MTNSIGGRHPHYFVQLSAAAKDQSRVYHLLVLHGPMTLPQLRAETNWTTHRASAVLGRLKKRGDVRLIEAGQHQDGASMTRRCGRWEAIT